LIASIVCSFLVLSTAVQTDQPTAWMFTNGTVLTFIVQNTQSSVISVLKYGTPLENTLWTSAFIITDMNGTEVTYVGKMARRVWPAPAESFAELLPGDVVSGSVDLAEHYDFPAPGRYTVVFEATEQFLNIKPVVVDVSGSSILHASLHRQKRYTVTNCGDASGTKYKNIAHAMSISMAAAQKSVSCLQANSCGSVYTTWFGAQTPARLSAVTNKFAKIVTAFSGSWIAYCDGPECTPNVYAYVFPSDARRNIYSCSLFYNNKNAIELVNTPVHEMSHFSTVAGTKDIVYGEAKCKSLASSNPDQAITNADNLGYFAYFAGH